MKNVTVTMFDYINISALSVLYEFFEDPYNPLEACCGSPDPSLKTHALMY